MVAIVELVVVMLHCVLMVMIYVLYIHSILSFYFETITLYQSSVDVWRDGGHLYVISLLHVLLKFC